MPNKLHFNTFVLYLVDIIRGINLILNIWFGNIKPIFVAKLIEYI